MGADLSLEDHRRLKEFFGARTRGARPATVGLLTGYIRCASCGARMFSSRRSDNARRYVCTKTPGTGACGKTTTRAEPLEDLVAELIIAAVDDAGLRSTIETKGEKDDGLVDLVRADEEALEALAKDFYAERLCCLARLGVRIEDA